ncbi:MAG: hypothetical protein ABII00_10200 [Elusimicrobiota bacterium]
MNDRKRTLAVILAAPAVAASLVALALAQQSSTRDRCRDVAEKIRVQAFKTKAIAVRRQKIRGDAKNFCRAGQYQRLEGVRNSPFVDSHGKASFISSFPAGEEFYWAPVNSNRRAYFCLDGSVRVARAWRWRENKGGGTGKPDYEYKEVCRSD